jgi:hypothetical protein
MSADVIETTAHFRKLQKTLVRRVANRKVETHPVQVVYIGGCYRARIEGQSIAAFGETPSEAKQKLTKLLYAQSVIIPKFDDREADRKEWLAECAAARAAKNSRNFDTKRG